MPLRACQCPPQNTFKRLSVEVCERAKPQNALNTLGGVGSAKPPQHPRLDLSNDLPGEFSFTQPSRNRYFCFVPDLFDSVQLASFKAKLQSAVPRLATSNIFVGTSSRKPKAHATELRFHFRSNDTAACIL